MNHTFVICAYKESPYIERCIESIKAQSVASEVILATATPSPYLENICKERDISYKVREGNAEISADWNYALSLADTTYVTLAHQDDVYEPKYVETILLYAKRQREKNNMNEAIIFSDYYEIVDGEKRPKHINLLIKELLLFPLRRIRNQKAIMCKRMVIRFGNAISCPTITYNMEHINLLLEEEQRKNLFATHFRSNLDWEAWEWLSKLQCSFVYIPELLMGHRIHEESETSAVIGDNGRIKEDYEMFCKFWPKWIARIISKAYKKSEKGNKV